MKFLKKVLVTLMCLFCMFSIINIHAYADLADLTGEDEGKVKWNGFTGADGSFTTSLDNKGDAAGVETAAQNILGTMITVIRVVGTGIAIIMLSYVAIKYMMAAPNDKAEFKKSATAFIVGAVVLFAATNLLAIINEFATKNI